MVSTRKTLLITLCMILMLSVLAACGGNSNSNSGSNGAAAGNEQSANNSGSSNNSTGNSSDAQATERTLTDPLGHTVTIPAQPERIIASYLEDYLVALDVQPAAQWSVSDSPMAYLQYALKDVPILPYDLPFEIVTGHNP